MTLLSILFVLGYLGIVFEHKLYINKTAFALFTGTILWAIYAFEEPVSNSLNAELAHHLSEISGILFFLLGAMTIVEVIDTFHGFHIITSRIKSTNKTVLIWTISLLTFFLSAALDNLTTTIVMVTLLRKLLVHKTDRAFMVGLVVLAANAGGAFSPIGDVTTTMLWIGGQISTVSVVQSIFLPSLACLIVPLAVLSFLYKGDIPPRVTESKTATSPFEQYLIFFMGIGALLFVPIFKTITHLPPYMGILFGLSVLWATSEILGYKKNEEHRKRYSIYHALTKLDVPTVLFFLGILLAVSALQTAGILNHVANYMDKTIGNYEIITVLIGLLSSIVDNVPLVAASMGMYNLEVYPQDHAFWNLMAYCAGTGGSCLIIGSAAGVAAMGMEKIDFFWYLKKISPYALLGYFSGVLVFLAMN